MKEKTKKKNKKGSFFKDFKAFISKGNIVDLAVAVIIGGAFGKIVTSLVNDIVMPLISAIVGGADVSDWKWIVKPATFDEGGTLLTAESALKYGAFLQSIIDFLIIAFFIFLALRIITASQRKLSKLANEISEKRKVGNLNENEASAVEQEVEAKTSATDVPVSVESQEDILKDIRDLLKAQAKPVKSKKISK